jgi:pimeloyl-ACP methyl ester carboxylesterase
MQILQAGLSYFLAVFLAGFLLGTARVLWLAPAVGPRAAELAELPLMLAFAIAAAVWLVRRFSLEPAPGARLGMGVLALALLLAAEFSLVLPARGMTAVQYLANLDVVAAAAYYAALVVMAVAPLFAPPSVARQGRLALASVVAVLAAATAVVVLKYRQDLDAALARVAVGSELVQTPCGPIEYAVVGEGPAVLIVHGAGGGFDQTAGFAQEFAGRGFRVVTMSRFGYLRTPPPALASPAAQADAHACLLDALKIPRAAIVGASAGAPSSMQFALRHAKRCSALVLLVPLAYAPQAAERLAPPPAAARWMFDSAIKSDFLYWLAAEVSPSLVIGSILATPPYLVERADAAEKARIDWMLRQPLPLSARQAGLLNDVRVAVTLERYELEHVAVPTLVISARDDFYGTYASSLYTAQHISGARFLGLEDGGHLWVGHHREVMNEIVSFLSTSAR